MVYSQEEVQKEDIICPFSFIPDPTNPTELLSMKCRTSHCGVWRWADAGEHEGNLIRQEERLGYCGAGGEVKWNF